MNNWWEELKMGSELKEFHEKMSDKMNIPSWAIVNCPKCDRTLHKREIRGIQLKFNARNIGDIAVEYCCEDCRVMDTFYFRQAVKNVSQFAELMKDRNDYEFPTSEPVTEDKMYELQYNNLMEEKIFQEES